jgi:hypothetical protein
MKSDTTHPAIRIHAFEFGIPEDSHATGKPPRFQDIRMTAGFPVSAVRTARLAALSVRRNDLWRLIDPAASDGAILVWPACPPLKRIRLATDDEVEDSPATRVISLIRTAYPAVPAGRWRASLNARSIVVAESEWERHAPSLVRRAPALLRRDFDAIFGAHDDALMDLHDQGDVAEFAVRDHARSPTVCLRQSMMCERPLTLGPEAIGNEADFWSLAADALCSLPVERRGRVSLASGFAPPFVQNTIRFVPSCVNSVAAPIRLDREPSPSHTRLCVQQSAGCSAFGRLLVASTPLDDVTGVDELHCSLSGRNGSLPTLVREISHHFGDRAAELATWLGAMSRDDRPSVQLSLDLLEGCARIAFCLPAEGPVGSWRDHLVEKCEDRLLQIAIDAGYLGVAELRCLQTSPALSNLVQRIIETRPHAIVSRLQISLTMLAHGGAAEARLLDGCLRAFVPSRWSAGDWLVQFDQEWAIHRAIAALRTAHRSGQPEPADLERRLLNRLSCVTLDLRRPSGKTPVPMLPQILDQSARQPA